MSSLVQCTGRAVAAVVLLVGAAAAHAATVSDNTGGRGPAANGTNADGVTFADGVVPAGGDQTAVYPGTGGANTVVPFHSALNPAAASPFTVEFWARPTASDNDDAPVSNRVASGNRSGWVFFQRAADAGWNFRMYNGNGGGLGWDLTGGASPLGEWSHVAVTWDGDSAALYVNGQLADDSNDPAATGVYNASTAGNFIVASSDTGSPYTGGVDEVAFYGSALSPAQILNHFTTATSAPAGAYHALVRGEGALLQLSNNVPEPGAALALAAAGAVALVTRRRARA